jgi:uncharacterized membrane protein
MRLFLATLTMALALSATAIAQPAGPDPATNSQQPAVTTDLRAPDQVAPAPPPAVTTDLRAPDQVAPSPPPAVTTDLRAPDQVAPAPPPAVTTPAADDGPGAIVFVLIGLGAAILLLAGGYFGVRYRHRVAIADDLAVQ